ncbi:hypothetical protein VXQ42_15415 [Acinetobacter baumannii]|uniref:hypothetical protein n=1 Tax=Acinetobacter calcoaceticus/baumannii complex TaxID=909768 RepID=UPI00057DFE49|nr:MULTISPECIES: hypothetical protein [Acinetobacter calcoaceticus/baumannii complex]AJB47240.1 hypothetical protein RR32_03595 [Acinetobacter nosocomialis]MDA3482448.1 hypothetical protein [Acinetobacter baumannii]TPS20823.1 hypothetical protein FJV09_17800 [Acinetobacter baumannii]WGT82540.1 hypothetical protein QE150_04280 [Acinetobacter baumannii]
MFKQKYIITVESESPPQICLGDKIHGATVISLEVEQYPDLVDLAWLTKRFPLSREMLSQKLELFNVGGSGKKFYDPNIVIPFLKTDLTHQIGRPRKN